MSRLETPEIMQGYGDVAGARMTPEQFQNALPREVSFAHAFGGFTDFCRDDEPTSGTATESLAT
jgi:hypothetical protein